MQAPGATTTRHLETEPPFGFRADDLGTMHYREAWGRQHAVHQAVAEGRSPPVLLLVEHPRVITFGRRGGRRHLRLGEDELSARGFDLVEVERGGDVTYHGPGQLVGYPIFPIGRRVREHLRLLELVLIRLLAGYGIEANGSPGYAGVWVGDEKVAAIGVAVQRQVSFHGFALNVSTDLDHFKTIVPCGLEGKGVVSMAALLGWVPSMDRVKRDVIESFRAAYRMPAAFSVPTAPAWTRPEDKEAP